MHASSEQFSKFNYVERGLSRLFAGHGELPHEVLRRNLMELCELRRSLWTFNRCAISAMEGLFLTKNTVQYLWFRRDPAINVLYDGQCRTLRSHLKILVVVIIFSEARIVKCVQLTFTGQGTLCHK